MKMKSYFLLSNSVITSNELTHNEFAVYTYLLSVYSNIRSKAGHEYKRVRQQTIAAHCGIKSTQTVSRIIESLMRKGYITHIIAAYRKDNRKGTYTYVLNPEKNTNAVRLAAAQKFYKSLDKAVVIDRNKYCSQASLESIEFMYTGEYLEGAMTFDEFCETLDYEVNKRVRLAKQS